MRALSLKPELTHLLHYSTSAPSSSMNISEKAVNPRESGRRNVIMDEARNSKIFPLQKSAGMRRK